MSVKREKWIVKIKSENLMIKIEHLFLSLKRGVSSSNKAIVLMVPIFESEMRQQLETTVVEEGGRCTVVMDAICFLASNAASRVQMNNGNGVCVNNGGI